MADYALKLPDHDLTPNEFKELARRIGRAAFTPLFLRYYERVITSEASIEEQRRGLADIARWIGVEEEKKLDPNANLPVFNIIFGAPGQSSHSIEAVEVLPAHSEPVPEPLPEPLEPAANSLASVLDPQEIAMIHRLMEPTHVQAPDPAPAPVDQGAQRADAPRRRRNKRNEGERPEAVQPAGAQDASTPALQDGAAIQREEVIVEMSMDDHLADLDRALGL